MINPHEATDQDAPDSDAWDAWIPREAAAILAGAPVPWCIVGGWAIDLWLGKQTRFHEDIEVAIQRLHFAGMRDHLGAFQLYAVGSGIVRALPVGQLPAPEKHQVWVLDKVINRWRMDIMLEPGDAQTWVFRRDERISAPRASMVGVRDGIPYLQPQGVLLFKAKAARDKDEADFGACLPGLAPDARAWLGEALKVAHPGHSWIERLAGEAL